MISIEHHEDRNMILVRASDVLTSQDYEHAIPELENAVDLAGGPLRVMIRLEDFQGWEIDALWRELKLDLERRGDAGRIAVVCETGLQEWAVALSAPFAKADVKVFSTGEEAEAQAWLRETPGESRAEASTGSA